MPTAIATPAIRRTAVLLKPKTLQRLYQTSVQLTELLEDAIEEQGGYRPEFLTGLRQSVRDMQTGRVRKIRSLADLR